MSKENDQYTKETLHNIVSSLIDVFRIGDEDKCSDAIDALDMLPIMKYEKLIPALKDRSANVRRWVIIALGRANETCFADQLVCRLCDKSKKVRETAYNVLTDMLDSESLLYLMTCQFEHLKSYKNSKFLSGYIKKAYEEVQLLRAGLDPFDISDLRNKKIIVVKRERNEGVAKNNFQRKIFS